MAAGRPKLTDALAERICEILLEGNYRAVACRLVGLREPTLSDWMHRPREPYLSFQKKVREAEAEAERRQLEKITGSPEPADAKWYLSRKFPDRWAETRRINVEGRIDQGARVNADALQDPEARQHILGLATWLFSQDDNDTDANDTGEDGDTETV